MRFLFDESVERRLTSVLVDDGHEVTVIGVDYPASLDDIDVLHIAHRELRILVTNDTDFGELVFRLRSPHSGIILLRLPRFTTKEKGVRLAQAVESHADALTSFVVVTPRGVRVRRQ